MKHIVLLSLSLALLTVSCEDNDEKYHSEPPTIADITFQSLATGSSEIHVGEKFVATLKQRKKGRLLHTARYTWNTTPDGLTHRYTPSVIYDKENSNPTDTLIATTPGKYEINFTGSYEASGNNTTVWSNKYGKDFTAMLNDGEGTARYITDGMFHFTLRVQKTVRILPE